MGDFVTRILIRGGVSSTDMKSRFAFRDIFGDFVGNILIDAFGQSGGD